MSERTLPKYKRMIGPTKLYGMDIPKDIEVTVFQEYLGDNYRDPFWYSSEQSDVLLLEYKDRKVFLDAPGEVRLCWTEPDWQQTRFISGPQDLTKEEYAQGDKWFPDWDREVEQEAGWVWMHNNWFELFYTTKGDKYTYAVEQDVCYDYKEGLAHAIAHIQDENWWDEA